MRSQSFESTGKGIISGKRPRRESQSKGRRSRDREIDWWKDFLLALGTFFFEAMKVERGVDE